MRAVLTRVKWARVRVAGDIVGEIAAGICALVGAGQDDRATDAEWIADKICGCRFFRDSAGKMNRSLTDTGGALLLISQFTLYGDMRRGNRPSFGAALAPDPARALLETLRRRVEQRGIEVRTGVFGAHMEVESLNDGPVTLLLDSTRAF
jgi:D-tyrosyl-tRNA(Tyr) deacylase